MSPRTRSRRPLLRAAAALAAAAASGTPLLAQLPPPAPLPLPPEASVPLTPAAEPAPPIEIYYGTRRVNPAPKPPAEVAPAAAVVPEATTPAASPGDAARTADAFIDTLREVRDGTNKVSTAAAALLGKVAERTHPPEPKQLVVTNSATPAALPPLANANAPWLAAPAPVAVPPTAKPTEPAAAPSVVVIREQVSEPKPAAAPAVVTLSAQTLVACGIAACGTVLGLLGWARGGRKQVAAAVAPVPQVVPPEAPLDPNAVRLQGKYNAGPLPESAEKFELGPTYHDEVRQKKLTEEQNNAAAVEFILTQNLALLAELNPGSAADPVVDHGGYALPAEAAAPADEEFTLAVRGAAA